MSDGVFDPGKWPQSSRRVEAVPGGSLSVRRLREIEALLGVTIGSGADAVPGSEDVRGLDIDRGFKAERGSEAERGLEAERQALELLRAFYRIADSETRREVLRLVQAVARGDRT